MSNLVFNFKSKKKFDFVQSRGALAHTENPKLAFKKCASFLKKGGIIIYGDPNQFGGFQNMLQRYVIYSLSNNENEMINNQVEITNTDKVNDELKMNYKPICFGELRNRHVQRVRSECLACA